MKKIRKKCGIDLYERILFDAALGRSLASFSVIGDPVNYMKKYVDLNYKQVAKNWDGGYPRVLPEVLLKTYQKPEGAVFKGEAPAQTGKRLHKRVTVKDKVVDEFGQPMATFKKNGKEAYVS